jgi:hypothetical protein
MGTAMMRSQDIPLDIVGSSTFGRYSKISSEQTFNMFISDGWMVPYPGHLKAVTLSDNGQGRGLYGSARYDHMIAVADDSVYAISENLSRTRIATIETSEGDVFISENNADQIAICDKSSIYVYDYRNHSFSKAVTGDSSSLDFAPGYVTFLGGYIIAPSLNRPEWRLSGPNNAHSFPADAPSVGELQTKPDEAMAAIRFPGKGNLILVFGKTVTEMWYLTGTQLFPFTKNTFNNVDFGCANQASIGSTSITEGQNLTGLVAWVGQNENSGPCIMFTDGNSIKKISSDGINFRLAELQNPKNCYGFCFIQDGHPFYQVSWPDDGLTLLFDFETNKFFTLCDHYQNCHPAKAVAFFNNKYYFISFEDGNLYQLSSEYTTYNGLIIPRMRVCKNIRLPKAERFVVNNVTFTLEQGSDSTLQRVDFSFSKDGGESYSSIVGKELNPLGRRQNKLNFWPGTMANDFVCQFRFWGEGRFLATDGSVSIYQ